MPHDANNNIDVPVALPRSRSHAERRGVHPRFDCTASRCQSTKTVGAVMRGVELASGEWSPQGHGVSGFDARTVACESHRAAGAEEAAVQPVGAAQTASPDRSGYESDRDGPEGPRTARLPTGASSGR